MESGHRKRPSYDDEHERRTESSSKRHRDDNNNNRENESELDSCNNIIEILLKTRLTFDARWKRLDAEKAALRSRIAELEAKVKEKEKIEEAPACPDISTGPQDKNQNAGEAEKRQEHDCTEGRTGNDDEDDEDEEGSASSSILALLAKRNQDMKETSREDNAAGGQDSATSAAQELQAAAIPSGAGHSEARRPDSAPQTDDATRVASPQEHVIVLLDSDDESSSSVPAHRPSRGESSSTHAGKSMTASSSRVKQEDGQTTKTFTGHQHRTAEATHASEPKAGQSVQETPDDELIFVSATAQLGGDLPHPRSLCPKEKFHPSSSNMPEADRGEANARICRLCYCYLCDVEAKDCARWQPADGGHCNAHSGEESWKQLRTVYKKGLLPYSELVRALGATDGCAARQDAGVILAVQQAFTAYHKGKEAVHFDPIRRRNVTGKEYHLHGLGDIVLPVSTSLRMPPEFRLSCADPNRATHLQTTMPTGAFERNELASVLSRLDGMLAAALSNTWRRNTGGNDQDRNSQAAYEQYWLFVKTVCHSFACALLIGALQPTVTGVNGTPIAWITIARAVLDRLERFKASLPPRTSEIRTLLESVGACVSNGWNMLVLPGASGSINADNQCVVEGDATRMIRLRALMASGVHSRYILSFCSSENNQSLMRSAEVQELLLTDGMIEETCDAMILMAPTKALYNDGFIQQKRFDDMLARVWTYDVGAGAYMHTHMHACTHTHTHVCVHV